MCQMAGKIGGRGVVVVPLAVGLQVVWLQHGTNSGIETIEYRHIMNSHIGGGIGLVALLAAIREVKLCWIVRFQGTAGSQNRDYPFVFAVSQAVEVCHTGVLRSIGGVGIIGEERAVGTRFA